VFLKNTLPAIADIIYPQAVQELRLTYRSRTATSANHDIVPAMPMKEIKEEKLQIAS
jgi:hypothetical protein